jgi:hypothetical protein
MKVSKFAGKCSFVVLCITLVLLSFVSCVQKKTTTYLPIDTGDATGYQLFSSSNGTVHFSLEYPSSYNLINGTTGDNNPFLSLTLLGHTEDEFITGNVKFINISITNYSKEWLGFPDAKTAMEKNISEYKWSLKRNFRLVEKHKAIVDGIDGWETNITFRERPQRNLADAIARAPIFAVARDLFFDYQGMTWHISLYTDKGSYEKQTKADFEHILRTFKFPK